MDDYQEAYQILAKQLAKQGIDVAAVKATLKGQQIETPSWGYANSGTRFKAFAWPGAAVTRGTVAAREAPVDRDGHRVRVPHPGGRE